MTESASPNPGSDADAKSAAKNERPRRGRIRDNFDAFAIAILFAVLMKYFAIEAYVIPTSSMQPTMMGSESAGVYDRILVDKFTYLLHEPARWDIAVFRYPIRRVQSYVKRIAGLPGEKLCITAGNLYRVRNGGDPTDPADLEPLPRPSAVRDQHWKEIYPARIDSWNLAGSLGTAIRGDGPWEESDPGNLTVELSSRRKRASLFYADDGRGGLVDRISDGYPAWVAQKMIANQEDPAIGLVVVQDARVRFALTPGNETETLEIELVVLDDDANRTRYALRVDADGARLLAERGAEKIASDPVAIDLAAGRTVDVEFVHVDDRLTATLAGEELALDVGQFRTVGEIFVPDGNRPSDRSIARLSIDVAGSGRFALDDLTIERDLHYRPTNMSAEGYRVFDVPEDSYFMLGDNTRQSTDSRDWQALRVGVDDQGRVVNPTTHPDARKLVGNFRVSDVAGKPINDENPVPVMSESAFAFTDDIGDIYRLEGRAALDVAGGRRWGDGVAAFVGVDDEDAWIAETFNVHFVPREDILGRPLVTFWPVWPWFRIGVIQ